MTPRPEQKAPSSTSAALDSLRTEVLERVRGFSDEQREIPSALPYLSFIRMVRPTEMSRGILKPSMCLVVQGEKRLLIGKSITRYGRGFYVASAIDMPVSGQVTEASRVKPYLGVRIDLDPRELADVIIDSEITLPNTAGPRAAAYVDQADEALHDAFLRLVRLLATPKSAAPLGRLVKQEILYRLLTATDGDVLARTVLAYHQEKGVNDAIEWIKKNYDKPMKIEKLARAVSMSVSSLHHRFKAVTVMSPLQYQKQIRLLEARRLLLAGDSEAATVAFKVGYESPSQFSREYRRFFGAPPLRDIAEMREQDVVH
jgi:AraC-like DNA-binding protein